MFASSQSRGSIRVKRMSSSEAHGAYLLVFNNRANKAKAMPVPSWEIF